MLSLQKEGNKGNTQASNVPGMLRRGNRSLRRFGLFLFLGIAGSCLCPIQSRAQGAPHANTLAWTSSATSGVTGYKVYRATVSGGPYTLVTSTALAASATSYSDTNTTQGVTHYYVVTALVGTNESVFSNQASATDAGTNVNPPSAVTATSN